jgi:hypothetical protein
MSFNYQKIMQPNTIIMLTKDEFLSMVEWLNTNQIKWYGGKNYTSNNILVCFNESSIVYIDFYLGESKSSKQLKGKTILTYSQIVK